MCGNGHKTSLLVELKASMTHIYNLDNLVTTLPNEEAPIVMVYHLVRIYAVILLAPYIGRLLGFFLK